MEVKDKLKPYLGTNTILIIDSEEDWLLLYKYIGNGWSSTRYKETSDLCIKLNSDNYADLNYMKKSYNSYNFIFLVREFY